MNDVMILLMAYLVGAIPSAVIYAKLFKKADVRTVGTGNVGTMNALSTVGWKVALPTLMSDVFKGYWIYRIALMYSTFSALPIIALFVAILGHNHSIYIGFKGGKGFATLNGGLFLINPYSILILTGVIALLLLLTKHPRVTGGLTILTLPLVFLVLSLESYFIIVGLMISILIFMKHIDLIKEYFGISTSNNENQAF